ncbi:MAG: acetoin utilization protein AcuC [Chloroflexi bacterium]|nr:acetoin utilization protein AcuC [Chloroflexota bacterium]
MACRAAFVYSSEYLGYKLSDEHPLNPIRLALTDTLVEDAGLLADPNVFREAPRPATEDELLLVHDRPYVDRVRELSSGRRSAYPDIDYGLGSSDNPAFVGMHDATSLVVGGTLRAAELVMEGRVAHAFNPGGGLHHAARSLASGFCIYNDPAVGIAWLRHRGLRVLYVDTDAHHGDGVQWIFYEDPDVLTISLHESGRYLFPGTGGIAERGRAAGYGYAVNVPLQPYTDHASWTECYDLVVPPLARAFRPDVVVTQNGCDGHALDPLTHLHAQTPTFEHFARRAHELAHELCDGRLVATGGGGYALWTAVPRAWTAVWAAISDQPLPELVPPAWRERWAPQSPETLPTRMHDPIDALRAVPRQQEIAAENRRVALEVRDRGLPPS